VRVTPYHACAALCERDEQLCACARQDDGCVFSSLFDQLEIIVSPQNSGRWTWTDDMLSYSRSAPPEIARRQTGVRRPLSNQMLRQQTKIMMKMWYDVAIHDGSSAAVPVDENDATTVEDSEDMASSLLMLKEP
jgi:hypothetical protein